MNSLLQLATTTLTVYAVLAVYSLEYAGPRDGVDETATVMRRLSPAVSARLLSSAARIIRPAANEQKLIAAAGLRLFTRYIYIDYNILDFEPALEDFIIAHEIGHYISNDAHKLRLFYGAAYGLLTTLAIEATHGISNPFEALLIGPAVIVIGFCFVLPINRLFRRKMEFNADEFAAGVVGSQIALTSLRSLKTLAAVRFVSSHSIMRDLDGRIKRAYEMAIHPSPVTHQGQNV